MTDSPQKYNKPPLSIAEQIALLKQRGLIVEDTRLLESHLRNISYFHLSIYFKHFQKEDDVFRDGVTFEQVLKVYFFDNELRLLLLGLLERIEISFKSRMINELAIATKNSHCHIDPNIFHGDGEYAEMMALFAEEIKNSKEISIAHYKEKYSEPVFPPIWVTAEALSFGQCIKFCKALDREHRNKIARTFRQDEKFVMNWMHCLSALRNYCAHHVRLWNRSMTILPKMNHRDYEKYFETGNKRLFNYLVILQIFMCDVEPSSQWLDRLESLIKNYNIAVSHMGFPEDWKQRLESIASNK
jgi:abortive infection bacteriophage resistance protein